MIYIIKFSRIIFLLLITSLSYGENLFQNLDNQIAIGYSYNSINTYNPTAAASGTKIKTNSQNLNLHLEQLFNNNIWLDGDGSFAFKAQQDAPSGSTINQTIQELNFPATLNAKFGYSFNWAGHQHGIQIIPYITIARNLNYNSITIFQNGLVNSYYNGYGGGFRVEYVLLKNASLFFDHTISYLQDPSINTFNLSAISYNNTLGIKYNLGSHLQFSAQGIFNQTNLVHSDSVGYDPITLNYINTAQTNYSEMFSLAYLFAPNSDYNDNDSNRSDINLASFDNNYNAGIGFTRSNASYKSGDSPTINSTTSYFTLNATHLFDNDLWINLNSQLINTLNQNNNGTGSINTHVPTIIGFPGTAQMNLGYAFPLSKITLQFIPYLNGGILMNINSYSIRTNTSIVNAIAKDMYLQYGLGGRVEYAFNKIIQVYGDQSYSELKDQSSIALNSYETNSQLGIRFKIWNRLQLGVNGFYQKFFPYGDSVNVNGTSYASLQQTLGAQIDLGISY